MVLAGLACAAALVVVLVVLVLGLSRASHETAAAVPPSAATEIPAAPAPASAQRAASPTTASPAPVATATPTETASPSVEEILQAQGSVEPGTVDVLIAGLASKDAVAVAESANGLVGRGALSALPALVDFDVVGRPWAAPSVIYAMGRLAAKATPEERSPVVDRLLALLESEKRRPSPEALANLLHIYEALGQTGDARAIAPLERELVDSSVATAPKVVVVQALVALGARQSRPTLERVRDELLPTATGDDFEAAVRRDLIAAIREALVQLS